SAPRSSCCLAVARAPASGGCEVRRQERENIEKRKVQQDAPSLRDRPQLGGNPARTLRGQARAAPHRARARIAQATGALRWQ
ncbi:unnamed protein product, partial [Amoebophrya sp. A25]